MATSRFIIKRKDLNLDQVVIESEGLTIGRLSGNDLVLNHPTVSRTHAGIKEINGDYWIFNLSKANGTLLNGELVESTPLADGDLIQIGPFFLSPTYTSEGLTLTVEMSVKPLPAETPGTQLLEAGGEGGKTVLLSPEVQRMKPTPKGTRRLSGTGLLTGMLPQPDEQALKVFWEKRQREAGKLAAGSPLKPQGKRRLGKAQFNWRPTQDLQRPWPLGIFTWGTIAVTLLSVVAAFAYKEAYSPGALSAPHARAQLAITPAIATRPNAGSCTTCHALQTSIEQNCASCHTTPAFDSRVSEKHMAVGLRCADCHSEHQGVNFQPALVANASCVSCHRDGVVVQGKALSTPHGGVLGYPVEDGRWVWAGISQVEWQRKGLPGLPSQFTLKEQFHLIHIAGRRQGRANCTDCHQAGFEGEALFQGVRQSCASCHEIDYQVGDGKEASTGCVSCHAQHGEEKELRASMRHAGQ